jgi:hypothetical protein
MSLIVSYYRRRYVRKGTPNRRRYMLGKPWLDSLCHHTPVVFYNLSSPVSTPRSWSCEVLSSCLIFQYDTPVMSIDDRYALLDLSGY